MPIPPIQYPSSRWSGKLHRGQRSRIRNQVSKHPEEPHWGQRRGVLDALPELDREIGQLGRRRAVVHQGMGLAHHPTRGEDALGPATEDGEEVLARQALHEEARSPVDGDHSESFRRQVARAPHRPQGRHLPMHPRFEGGLTQELQHPAIRFEEHLGLTALCEQPALLHLDAGA
jgi:hypothetical protein